MGLKAGRMNNDELEKVSGGTELEGSFSDISQCPPGTIDMKGKIPDSKGTQKVCPYCGSKNLSDTTLFVPTWGQVVTGQICDDCKEVWQ